MTEKTPRLQTHNITDVARVGDEYYHPPRAERLPLTPDQQRLAGQLSLRERAYPEDPRDLAEHMELVDNSDIV